MTVVVIITILAAIAIPAVQGVLQDRRTHEAAQRVGALYQNARMRAMGRGAAILVRYTPGTRGRFQVLEAQRGTVDAPVGTSAEGCATLPVSSCLLTNWNAAPDTSFREITFLDVSMKEYYGELFFDVENEAGVALANLDICFTPMGRAFSRTTFAENLTQLNRTHVVQVRREKDGNQQGRIREVLVLPNGASRITL
jgi:type IV fimbrial biogenesis protein FimT